ncbi:MAG: hypothetical protein KDA20_12140 [Phycisphaerales bacterium]|nr:hypothetical protein [Phycisphaerales bacterium]
MTMRRTLIFSLAALTTLLCAAAARAADDWHVEVEPDWRGYYRATSPIAARDFQRYLDALALREDQIDMANDLYLAFENEIRDMSTLMREQRSDLQSAFQPDEKKQRKAQQARIKLTERFDARAKDLTQRLFADLRLTLTTEQEQAWQDLEQLRRRRETLTRFAAYPSENIDLAVIIDGIDMPQEVRDSLQNTLDNYLVELDNAVAMRNAKVESLSGPAREVVALRRETWSTEDQADRNKLERRIASRQEKLVSDAEQLRDLCKRVKDINDRYAQQISLGLSADLLPRFERRIGQVIDKNDDDDWSDYNRARWAIRSIERLEYEKPIAELELRAYGEDHDYYQRQADRLRAVPGLSERQSQEVATLKSEFETEYEALRKRHNQKARRPKNPSQFEFQLDGARLTLYQGDRPMRYWERWEEQEPSEDFKRDDADLSQRYIDRLRQILTLEQRSYIANH